MYRKTERQTDRRANQEYKDRNKQRKKKEKRKIRTEKKVRTGPNARNRRDLQQQTSNGHNMGGETLQLPCRAIKPRLLPNRLLAVRVLWNGNNLVVRPLREIDFAVYSVT